MSNKTQPIQPLVYDEDGTLRFQANDIVPDMLDFSTPRGFDLNRISVAGYDQADQEQLAQLIGYSHSGSGDLSFMSNETWYAAHRMRAEGETEDQARAGYYKSVIDEVRAGIIEPMAQLLGVHPMDLSSLTREPIPPLPGLPPPSVFTEDEASTASFYGLDNHDIRIISE